ncbi:DUF1127 domain-containing protein [Sneathiella chungangensis]|uniref:DUF1127 domain-containing protein n=1 Tax=Sneathiella chungangensis TaxID=1418234 RepID=A0A845MF39_9PROT|nr:DUF1127 domain-containing protein [Sneathiella chungangensis]MZR22020.1 DUF1127 domain-containing protein [Sneathiella chungangensis]
MISYSKKEIEALAMIEPVNANSLHLDTQAYINHARKLRSEYMTKKLSDLYQAVVGKYLKNREIAAAKDALYAMSDRELQDIGISRSEIEQAVVGSKEVSEVQSKGFWKTLAEKFVEAQKARAAYVHLMAMNSRELADIGLTRGEIDAAIHSGRKGRANDNLAQPSNINDHRKAV